MEIHLLDGTTARPAKQVKAVQILRSQRADLEDKRLIQKQAFAMSEKEEKRAKELERILVTASQNLDEHERRLEQAPLGGRSQIEEAGASLHATAEFAEAEWKAQNIVAERAHNFTLNAERQVQALERVMVKNLEVEQLYDQQAQRELESRKKRADLVNTSELKAADTLENNHIQRMKGYEHQLEETYALHESQAQQAKKYHKDSVKRMMNSTATTMSVMRELKAKKEADHNHRIDSILSLKANSDAAFTKMRGNNEKRLKRQNAITLSKEKEKLLLINKGENPYHVFKTRDVIQNANKKTNLKLSNVALKEAELVKRILVEDEYTKKKETEERFIKEQENKFRNELGRHNIEERNSKYLINKTTDKVDMIKTSSSSRDDRFQPSQVTTIKDNSFGLGFNPRMDKNKHAKIVEMVAAKPIHEGIELGEFARFLPKIPSSLLNNDSDGHQNSEVGNSEGGSGGGGGEVGSGGGHSDSQFESLNDFMETNKSAGIMHSNTTTAPSQQLKTTQKNDNSISTSPNNRNQLSKFEIECRLKAQERQRQALAKGEPQIAAGRLFTGATSFTPKPTKIEFLDFEIGKKYKKKLVLTNVSLTFNSFKILDLPDNIRDFFEIKYSKPGRMSAGTTCTIEIIFKPQIKEDFITSLPFLTETGPCSVPIFCYIQKVLPSIQNDHINFGEVIMGEIKTMKIVIKNSGCLPCSYEIFDMNEHENTSSAMSIEQKGKGLPAKQVQSELTDHSMNEEGDVDEGSQSALSIDTSQSHPGQKEAGPSSPYQSEMATAMAIEIEAQTKAEAIILQEAEKVASSALSYPAGCGAIQYESKGYLDSYSETHHSITFAPLSAEYYHKNIAIRFKSGNGNNNDDIIIPLGITGKCELFPVYVDEPIVDFRMVVHDKLYRKKLVLCNRGKIAFKVQAVVPKELAGYLEFGPDMGFVQPGVKFEIGIKIKPSLGLLNACRSISVVGNPPKSFVVEGSDIIAVPIHILVPKQAVPVFFTLKCQITSGKIKIGPTSDINFGLCYTTETLIKKLDLINQSSLPQKYGFVNLVNEIDVQPNDGFGVLLPHETKTLNVLFSPKISNYHYNFNLDMRTSMGDVYHIPVKGIGCDSPIELSHSLIQFTPTSVNHHQFDETENNNDGGGSDDGMKESIIMTNSSKTETYLFEWGIPYAKLSGLIISPKVAKLKPGQQVRIEIQFKPKMIPPNPLDKEEEEGGDQIQEVATTPTKEHNELQKETNEDNEGDGGGGDEEGGGGGQVVEGEKDEDDIIEGDDELALNEEEKKMRGERSPKKEEDNMDHFEDIPIEIGQISHSSLDEPWSVHATWNLPCIVKNADSDELFEGPPIYLVVKTVLIERVLEVSSTSLDFGELAVGQVKVMPLMITNHNENGIETTLSASGLNSLGPFSILSALRPIKPKSQNLHGQHQIESSPTPSTIMVKFAPEAQGIRQESLTLHSASLGASLHIALRGDGVSPNLTIDPADGKIDLGHCLEMDSAESELTLHNASVFPLTFKLVPVGDPSLNFNNQSPFSIIPSEASVLPGADLKVFFQIL